MVKFYSVVDNNERFTQRIIDEAIQRLQQLPNDEVSLIKFARPKRTVLAEPILLDRNGAIKEIAIQILDDEVYQNLGNLLRREDESRTLCESIIGKTS